MYRTYEELIRIPTFEERLKYLMVKQPVGEDMWGSSRRYNQLLYTSPQWRSFRNSVIIRDNGCDLAIPDRELHSGLLIHHLNPITLDDIINDRPCIFDLNNVVLTSKQTHQVIHYERDPSLVLLNGDRKPGDTKLWQ